MGLSCADWLGGLQITEFCIARVPSFGLCFEGIPSFVFALVYHVLFLLIFSA